MKARTWILVSIGLALALGSGARQWYRAAHDLVYLDVDDVPLRKVVSKLRWQTWEDIRVHRDVDGRVTLHCAGTPLETVLGVINEQVGAQWSTIYPLFRTKTTLRRFEPLLTGAATAPLEGWTNFNARPNFAAIARAMADTNSPGGLPGGPGPGFGGFGGGRDGSSGPNPPVTVDLTGQELAEVTAEFRRQSRAQIVPEDGTQGPVTLKLDHFPPDQAVAALANEVHRKWAKYYAFAPRRGPGQMSAADREKMRDEMANLFAGGERPSRDEIRARFEERANEPGRAERVTQRLIDSLKNTTPEQRAEQRRMRGRFGGGPGGPAGSGAGRPEGARGPN